MQPVWIYKSIAGIFSWLNRQKAFARASRAITALLACTVLSGPLAPSSAGASLRHYREYQVKAAFLFNFANFVEWPEEALPSGDKYFVISVIGGDPFGGALDSLKGKMLKGRNVMVRYCTDAAEARDSQILFVGNSERGNINHIVKALKGRPVLTIGDQEGFCQAGGMINMTRDRNRVRFEINIAAANRAGLQISSHLLKLAKEVIQ